MEGHIICGGCVSKVSRCPVCRAGNLSVRNRALEQLASTLTGRLDCTNKPVVRTVHPERTPTTTPTTYHPTTQLVNLTTTQPVNDRVIDLTDD